MDLLEEISISARYDKITNIEILAKLALYIQNNAKKVPVNIKEIVCKYYGITVIEIEKRTRKREINYPRQVAMWFEWATTKKTLAKIGIEYGGFDHATVLSSKKTINNYIDTDKDVRNDIEKIKNMIKNN